MPDNNKQNMISVSEQEFQALAQYFLSGTTPPDIIGSVGYMEAEQAVTSIAARIVQQTMDKNGATIAMETKTSEGNIIQLPIAKKW